MASSKHLPPDNTPFFPRLFIANQFHAKVQLPPTGTTLSGKVAIITGGNTGLGFESACQLLSFHLSHLIIAVRSLEKGDVAARKLRVDFPDAVIEVWQLDMASYSSIQTFIERAEIELARIDIVILNAGRMKFNHFDMVPSTGHEELIQINYLSTMLLAILLLPLLKNNKAPGGPPGRLTIVNAALSLNAKFRNKNKKPLIPSFDDPKSFNSQEWYNSSKLLAHMFLYRLVDLVSADDVILNLVDPGYVGGTELTRDMPGALVVIGRIFERLTARSVTEGASTYLDACVVKGKESHGCFIMGWQIKPFAPLLYTAEGEEIIERLWQETLDEFAFADVRDVLQSMKAQ